MASLRSWINIVESNNSAYNVKLKILSAIEKCNKHFGEIFYFMVTVEYFPLLYHTGCNSICR